MNIRAIIDGRVVYGWYFETDDGRCWMLDKGVSGYENEYGELELHSCIDELDLATTAIFTGKQDKNGQDIYGSKGDMKGGDMVYVDYLKSQTGVEWQVRRQAWGIWAECLCGFSSCNLEIIPQGHKDST